MLKSCSARFWYILFLNSTTTEVKIIKAIYVYVMSEIDWNWNSTLNTSKMLIHVVSVRDE